MRSYFFNTLYDICYLTLLCAVILITFAVVFLPQQPAIAAAHMQALPVLQHTVSPELAPQHSALLCISGLLYLKCIWRLIHH